MRFTPDIHVYAFIGKIIKGRAGMLCAIENLRSEHLKKKKKNVQSNFMQCKNTTVQI